ncbi:MAG: alkaline shock response membrane anchor protein AmaP [Candidatus Omnitrophota bacterium]
MDFFKRIGAVFYMLLMMSAGVLFLFISINVFPTEYWVELLNTVNSAIGYQFALGVIGCIFIAMGISSPYKLGKKLRKKRSVAFKNPNGEVTVSLSAIEDYIRKVAKDVSGVKDIRSRVEINKKGMSIVTDVSISAGENIPEVTERMQREIKMKIQGMLGVEEDINIHLHINKITKGSEEIGPVEPDVRGVPFR